MRISDAPAAGARLLVADDDHVVRTLFANLFRATPGIACVIEAEDGAEAVDVARERRFDIAVLDMNMPRLDGIEAALRLRALQPSLRIALHSSDPELLRQRAAGLELPLFDKVDFDRLLAWVERQAEETFVASGSPALEPKLDLSCNRCGYGIVSRLPPARCPMCGGAPVWAEPFGSTSRRAAADERLAG
jgi:CheY-like chemotaxis protein